MQIRKANDADLGEIRNLLNEHGLPVEDVSTTLTKGLLVAENANGTVVVMSVLVAVGNSGGKRAKQTVSQYSAN